MNARGLILTVLAAFGALVVASAPALATKGYAPGTPSSFGSEGAGNGQFSDPAGVTVNDATGDVYVLDKGNNRVEQFTAAGSYLAQFNGSVGPPTGVFSGAERLAVDNSGSALDPSKEAVYVADMGNKVIDKFNSVGVYEAQLTGRCPSAGTCPPGEVIPFEQPRGVAVDPSGNLWVLDGEENLDEFSNTGDFLRVVAIERRIRQSSFALDSSGDLYLVFNSFSVHLGVMKFDTVTGQPIVDAEEQPVAIGHGVTALAVNSSTDNLLVDEAEAGHLALYGPFAEPYGTPIQTLPVPELRGIAINGATGTAYVGQPASDTVAIFDYLPLPGVVTEAGSIVAEGSELLHGTVDPEGEAITECKFEYGTEQGVYPNSVPCSQSPAEIGAGTNPVAVSAEASGLTLNIDYHFRLTAVSTKGGTAHGGDETFFTATAPTVEVETFSAVGSTTAQVSAKVNANGAPTSYHVEYGTSTGYGSSTPESSLGAPRTSVGVLAQLTGLQPGTAYHVRLVATNALKTIAGQDLTFTTASSAGASALTLPDNRAYEIVSPPDNRDLDLPAVAFIQDHGHFTPESEWPFRAETEGNSVAYQGLPPTSGGNGDEVGNFVGNQFLAKRTAKGWEANDVTPAPNGAGEEFMTEFYQSFSSDLSLGIIDSEIAEQEGTKGQPLSATASPCDALYSRTTGDGAFHALFSITSAPAQAGCANAQIFAGANEGTPTVTKGSHNLFQTGPALTGEAETAVGNGQENLYDSIGGQLRSVNVLNDGKPDPSATFGGPTSLEGEAGPAAYPNFSNVISGDGSRIFWTALEAVSVSGSEFAAVPKALYLRKNDAQPQSPLGAEGKCTVPGLACTVQIDAAQPGATGSSGHGRFWTASADGSKVLFTDCSRLTESSTAVFSEGCEREVSSVNRGDPHRRVLAGSDLYEYDVNSGTLTDLTPDGNSQNQLGADVQGVLGASKDGSYVYFVASGALPSQENSQKEKATSRICRSARAQEAELELEVERELITPEKDLELIQRIQAEHEEEQHGQIPPKTGCNLYVLHEGKARFIQTLSPNDNRLPHGGAENGEFGDWMPDLGRRFAQATPDGHGLVFESKLRLTGYDNFSMQPRPHAALEVFTYDTPTGRLSCVSCQPSGAPPLLAVEEKLEEPLPASLQYTYMPRWISADGSRVFFNTQQPLVAQDTNSQHDVYEWEREESGSKSCPQQGSPRSNGGCLFVLSGGSSPYLSAFIDADVNGENVFFETRGRLVPQDHNGNLKLYDARVGGGFPESSLACEGTGCQGVPPAPPIFATPSSATFKGTGNFPPVTTKFKTAAQIRAEKLTKALKACRVKKNKHRRTICESQARRRYGALNRAKRPRHAKRAHANRRPKR